MKKIYVLAPLAGLILFGAVYGKHARLHEQRLAETRQQEAAVKREKLARLQTTQREAAEQAVIAQARRNQERAENERLEEARKQARLDIERQRDTAREHARRLRPQIDHLQREIETVNAGIIRSEE